MRKTAHNQDALGTCTNFQGTVNVMEELPLTSD